MWQQRPSLAGESLPTEGLAPKMIDLVRRFLRQIKGSDFLIRTRQEAELLESNLALVEAASCRFASVCGWKPQLQDFRQCHLRFLPAQEI